MDQFSAYMPPDSPNGFLPRKYTPFSSSFSTGLPSSRRRRWANNLNSEILFSNDSVISLYDVINSNYGTPTGHLSIHKLNLQEPRVHPELPSIEKACKLERPLTPEKRPTLLSPYSPRLSPVLIYPQSQDSQRSPQTSRGVTGFKLDSLRFSPPQIDKSISQEVVESKLDSSRLSKSLPKPHGEPQPQSEKQPQFEPMPQMDTFASRGVTGFKSDSSRLSSSEIDTFTSRDVTKSNRESYPLKSPALPPCPAELQSEPLPQISTSIARFGSKTTHKKHRSNKIIACNHCHASKARFQKVGKPKCSRKKLSDMLNIHQGVPCGRDERCTRPHCHPGHCRVGERQSIDVIRKKSKQRKGDP
ncbi:hypothetical protein AAMO2058_000679500 [Amorphochlora amoebiformis]